MKILLAHAYCLALDQAEREVMKPYPPLGILYLSAYLKQKGHEVVVFDGTFAEPNAFVAVHRAFQPEAIGFYANMMSRRRVLALRAMIGDDAPVAVGGPDPPQYADAYLDHGFDVVITGEGERPMTAWLEHTRDRDAWSAIEGLIFRRDGQTVHAPAQKPEVPLDDLPLPDRGAIDLEAYLSYWERHHGVRPISLITSRGCPYRCTWCSHNVYGYSLRKRSPEAVIEEMAWLAEHYRFDQYWFADDVFTIQPKWVLQLRDLLAQRPELRKPFECISRADRLTEPLVAALREMNCFRLWVGAESGSQRLLDLMKRRVTRDQVLQAMTWLREAGVETGMFFMWGFMDESYEDVLQTVDLAARCRPDIALTTIAYPIKGTVFHQNLQESGLILEEIAFSEGSDRDTRIKGQPGADLYRYANHLLHDSLRSSRLAQGSLLERAKSWAHRGRAALTRKKLKAEFARQAR